MRAFTATRSPSLIPSLALFGMLLLGAALRLYCLDCRSLWRDEIYAIELVEGMAGPFNGSRLFLSQFLTWIQVRLADPTVTSVAVRLHSAISGALLPLAAYALGRELFGVRQGILTASLVALSPILIGHSQEARTYGLVPLLGVCLVYALVRLERSGSWRWAAAAVAAAAINASYSNTVLFVALPAVLPLAVWAVWRLAGRSTRWRTARWSLLALIPVAATAVVPLVRSLGGRYSLGGLDDVSGEAVAFTLARLLLGFTELGLPLALQRTVQVGLVLLAAAGTLYSLRTRARIGLYVCMLNVAVPVLTLGAFAATNDMPPRYALSSAVFYYLLMAHGAVGAGHALRRIYRDASRQHRIGDHARLLTLAPMLALVTLFAAGAYNYHVGAPGRELTYRPDLRGVARYLSARAVAEDVIVFVGWDDAVSQFYWKNAPPAPVFLGTDPLLPAFSSRGDVYWVIESHEYPLPRQAEAGYGEQDVVRLEGVAIVRDGSGGENMSASLERLLRAFRGAEVMDPVVAKTLLVARGNLLQERGNLAQAAAAYRSTHVTPPASTLARDYLTVSQNWLRMGNEGRAYREAVVVRFHDPTLAATHRWLGTLLLARGEDARAAAAFQVADILETAS